MALKIRLRRQGRTNRPFYRLVVTDVESKRDGRYVEALGWYNPLETESEKVISVKTERVHHWLDMGAELSEKAEVLLGKATPELIKERRAKMQAKARKKTEQARARRKKKAAATK